MTDNEIIKALELCTKTAEEAQSYEGCPLLEFSPDYNECQTELMKQSLDLINRKNADIKQKDTEIDILIRKNARLKDEVSELREAILKGDFTSITEQRANELWHRENGEKIDGLKAEIERWKEQNVRLNKECDHYIRFAEYAKNEAYREFAERFWINCFKVFDKVAEADTLCLLRDIKNKTLTELTGQ